MNLFLDENIAKAINIAGGPKIKYDYWDEPGQPPAGGGWEQSPSGKWRRPRGSGGKQAAAVASSEQKTNKFKDSGQSIMSTNPKDYPTSSKPADHYKIAQYHDKTGYKEGAEGHKEIARERSKDLAPEEHAKLATQLKEAGMQEEAAFHEEKASSDERYISEDGSAKKQGKKPAKEQEKPKKPSNDYEQVKVQHHNSRAKALLAKLGERKDSTTDEAEIAKLNSMEAAVEQHASSDTVPTTEQSKQLKELEKISSEDEKKNKPEKQQASTPSKKTNWASKFRSHAAQGEAVGHTAASIRGGGDIGGMMVTYAASGALQAGQHLLSSRNSNKDEQESDNKEVKQSSLETKKSGLYLDLTKSVNPPNVGVTTDSDKHARARNLASYAKQPTGVSGASALPDDPDVGRKWKHDDDEDSVSSEVDKLLSKEEKEDKEETKKSQSLDLIKSIHSSIENEVSLTRPRDIEVQFMTEVLGYDYNYVRKGLVSISGRNRHIFNEWAQSQLDKSLSNLLDNING